MLGATDTSMQLIDDLINILSAEKPRLEDALIRAQILAHRLGEAELRAWVEWELRGYPSGADVPPYRVLQVHVRGVITNGVYRYPNQAIPLYHLEESTRNKLETARLTQSIAVIEDWAGRENLTVGIAPELYAELGKGIDSDYWVESAWRQHSAGAMLQVLVEVRARLLDFALRVSDSLPKDVSESQMKKASEEAQVSETFKHAVFGNNTTIVVGSGTIHGVTNSVVTNDFASLAQALRSNGVGEQDLVALEQAIREDASEPEVVQRKHFGSRVRAWMGSMVSKAGTSGWQLSIGAAANVLGDAIAKYYGFGT